MLFDLQEDHGSRIAFYVVPDGGGAVPKVRISGNGHELLEICANETLVTLVHAGRHSTGQCGFVIDEGLIPNLANYGDLEVAEADSNILIYRRMPPDSVSNVNVYRCETHLLPLWTLDDALKPYFCHWYKGIDRYGLETSTQVFCLRNRISSYVSGRLFYKNYEVYLNKGIKTIAMLRDPYDELAERLLILKAIGTRADDLLGVRDAMTYAAVIESLADFNEGDERSCKRFFKQASTDVLAILSDPVVRQLTASTPGERSNQTSIASALDVLATFELIGLRPNGADFRQGLADLMNVAESNIPLVTEYSRVTSLGAFLRGNATVESILEKDLEIFYHLKEAFESGDLSS